MSVVGIDLGYQSCYVAIARHGGVEVITNEYSERSSPSLVGFSSNQRMMSTSAKTKAVTNYKNTVAGFKALIGRKYSDPIVQHELTQQHYKVEQLPGDNIGIKVNYLNEETAFSPEQITSIMLTYLKSISEKALGKPVHDCVVSVPSYFTDGQRRAILDASKIAGLNCLRLLNETTAVALAYGIYKQDLPEEKEKSRNVVFVDMGHHALQVSVCAFNKGKLKVLSKAFDPMLGGRDFDQRLLKHFAEEFKKKYKIDTLSHSRQTLRLTSECEKLRKLMSANATPIPINIECFMDDKDVSGRMKRDEFQELCKDLLDRIKAPLNVALKKAGLKPSDIYAVEIVGGCTRIPAVKEIISNFFQREVSTTINQDEAVARGCALQCAILSPTFKVRDFAIQDIQPFPIQLLWNINNEPGEMVVFNEGDQIYHSKVLTFFRKESFQLTAQYHDPKNLPYPNPHIGKFLIKNVKPNDEGESSKVKVKVRLSINGVFFIKSATLVEKQITEEMETDGQLSSNSDSSVQSTDKPLENTKNVPNGPELMETQTNDSEPIPDNSETPPESSDTQSKPKPEETQPETTESQPQPETTEPQNSTENTEPQPQTETKPETNPKAQANTEASGKSPAAKKSKTSYKHVDLPIDDETNSMSKKEIDEFFEKECKMIQQDRLEIEKADAKNSVEEYVYDMRDKVETSLRPYINDEDQNVFLSLLNATEEWLYDEGEDQPKKVYVERLTELKKYGDPVLEREKEFLHRDTTFNELGQTIVRFEKFLLEHEAGDEKYDHLEESDIEKVKEAVAKKREWMETKMRAQQATLLTDDPIVKISEIRMTTENLVATCNPIMTKPKPKVEPPKDDHPGEEGDNKSQDEAMEEGPPPPQPEVQENPPTSTSEEPSTEAMDIDVD